MINTINKQTKLWLEYVKCAILALEATRPRTVNVIVVSLEKGLELVRIFDIKTRSNKASVLEVRKAFLQHSIVSKRPQGQTFFN